MEDSFSMDGVWEGMVQGVMQAMGWGAADEASLTRPPHPLTSCCAAWFLTSCGPVPVLGPQRLGTPVLEDKSMPDTDYY